MLGWVRPMACARWDQKRAGSESESSTWSQATASGRVASQAPSSVDLPEPAGALTNTRPTCASTAVSRATSSRERWTRCRGGTGGWTLVAARPDSQSCVTWLTLRFDLTRVR